MRDWTIPAQILSKRPHPLCYFFEDFHTNMLGDSISINKLCCSSSEKIGKTSKIGIFGRNMHKKGLI